MAYVWLLSLGELPAARLPTLLCYNLPFHANVIDDRHYANDGDASSALSMI
jgi:hypothetical protein